MALYIYKKRPVRKFPLLSTGISFIPFICIVFGLVLITWVAYPIISFELFLSPKFASLIRPIPDEIIVQAMENEIRVLGAEDSEENLNALDQIDYTKASNWFPQKPPEIIGSEKKEYLISIPKLKIKEARVVIGGENLEESLIHYGGTALPGDWGRAVIFGHSVLPQFFNPTNYKTIFSTLPTLDKKDQILINFDGIIYTYEIFDLKIVPPDDISVLEQKYDSSYLSLVTCVPPGTYWKRLIVKARIKKI
ncbi:sortase [Candidatus Microgenomates bacterium]|nr:sortase [Candidatus Microgenomates bacterium]